MPDVRLGVEGQQDNECVEMFHTYIHTCDISCSVYRLIADCVFTFSRKREAFLKMKMNFNRRHVWHPVILILGSLYGYMTPYMVLKTEDISDTTFHEPKLQSVYNHSVPRTLNAKKSVASNSTEIDGDERLQIGHYVAGFNLSLIGKEFNFDSSDLGKVHLI